LENLRVSGNTTLTTLKCFNNALTSLDVTSCSAMTLMSCYGNQLTTLSVEGCNALNALYCYQNKISGTDMTTLVNSLPTRSSSNKGELRAIFNDGENNSMTAAQITTARNKYWLPKRWDGVAWVELTAFLRGDVDGDTHVDINDVTKLIGIVLGTTTTDYNAAAADCDEAGGSGNIDINDVTALLNFVLNGHW